MQYQVARGTMSLLAQMGKNGQLDTLGISEDDFEKLNGQTPWIASDRNRVTQTLDALLCGTMDVIGVPRFQLPAEYIAGGIALFVAPINTHVACRFMEKVPSAEALGRGVDEAETCTAKQIFALVIQLLADPINSHAKHLWEKNTTLKIERAVKTEKANKGGKNEHKT